MLPAEQRGSPDLAAPSPPSECIDDLLCRRCCSSRHCEEESQVEALPALPTTLDDDALEAFDAILSGDKSTLPQALAQMAENFVPPSNKCQKFSTRRRVEAETPLTFRSTLMVLAKSAYPGIDHIGRDSLVLKRMLVLAQVAWCLQAHLDIQQRATVATCTRPPESRGAPEDAEPLQACASLDGAKWKTGDVRRQVGWDRPKVTEGERENGGTVEVAAAVGQGDFWFSTRRIPAPRILDAADCTNRWWIEERGATVIHSFSSCQTFFFSGGAAPVRPSSTCSWYLRGSGDENPFKNWPLK
ncbi:unnamed protein product [Lampetra fluviatilis]